MNIAKKSQTSKASKYTIPKNLCQNCYERKGRYVLHCFCIICQECYNQRQPFYTDQHNKIICRFCGGQTTTNVIDCTRPQSVGKLQFLFKNMNKTFGETIQAFKFQDTIRKRYCLHLQTKIRIYQDAIMDLVKINPSLENYFKKKLNMSSKQFQKEFNKENRHKSLPVPKVQNNSNYENQSQAPSVRSKYYGDRQVTMNQKVERSSSSGCTFQPNIVKRKIQHQRNFSGGMLKSNMRPQIKVDILGSKEVVRDILSDKKNKDYHYYVQGQQSRQIEYQSEVDPKYMKDMQQHYYHEKRNVKDHNQQVNHRNAPPSIQQNDRGQDYHQKQYFAPITPPPKYAEPSSNLNYQTKHYKPNQGNYILNQQHKSEGIIYKRTPKEDYKGYKNADRDSNNQFGFQKKYDNYQDRKQSQKMHFEEDRYSKKSNPIKPPSFNFQSKEFRGGSKK